MLLRGLGGVGHASRDDGFSLDSVFQLRACPRDLFLHVQHRQDVAAWEGEMCFPFTLS